MELNIPKYDGNTISLLWEHNFSIRCNVENSLVTISANTEGLISLARHLLTLAQKDVPVSTHIHLDEYNSLENGSTELVFVKDNEIVINDQ